MSIKLMSDVFNVQGITHAQKLLLLALADAANDDGVCWPSIHRLASKAMVEERSVTRMLAELELRGFVVRELRSGRSTMYTVIPPTAEPPHPRPPGHPTPDSKVAPPPTGGSPRTNKESKEKPKGTVKRPDGVDEQVWQDFLVHRNRMKAPVTYTAMQGFIREAANAGVTLEDALRISVERGWRGFRADWAQEKPKIDEKTEHYLRLTGRANKGEVIDV